MQAKKSCIFRKLLFACIVVAFIAPFCWWYSVYCTLSLVIFSSLTLSPVTHLSIHSKRTSIYSVPKFGWEYLREYLACCCRGNRFQCQCAKYIPVPVCQIKYFIIKYKMRAVLIGNLRAIHLASNLPPKSIMILVYFLVLTVSHWNMCICIGMQTFYHFKIND